MIAARLNALLNKINALTLRERLLLFAAALVVMGALWEAVLAGPLEAREQVASARVETLRQELEHLNQAVSAAANQIGDGMPGKLQRLDILRRQVGEAADSVRVFTHELVDPQQMRLVLEDLIRQQDGLKLVSMSNLAVEPLVQKEETAAGGDTRGPRLYRHGLLLVMEGPYLQCMEYLRAVEGLPWQLYWGRLELENDEYPSNRILIELHTLSLEEDWIGV